MATVQAANPESETCISIRPDWQPSLPAGSYEVSVRQDVGVGQEKAEYPAKGTEAGASARFFVSGPRFALQPEDIYSLYPAANATGAFAGTLPHAVLSRRTLPWERSPAPWIALLLLDEEELAPDAAKPDATKAVTGMMKRSEVIARLRLAAEPSDEPGAPCQTLILPRALFLRLAPARADLPWLAHVRRVGTGYMDPAGVSDEGWFAVVTGNRLVAPGKDGRAFLVSLEGASEWLPDDVSADNAACPDPVTLIVLASWRFRDEGKGFGDLARDLCAHAAPLRIAAPGSESMAEQAREALAIGYAPLSHENRQGDRSWSWYRGPLTPVRLPDLARYPRYPCADAALCYDPGQGVLDVSLAAAWQLGRLLALANQHFVQALARHAVWERRREKQQSARDAVGRTLGFAAERDEDAHDYGARVVQRFLEDAPVGETEATAGETSPPPTSAEVEGWLGRLRLLYGVPFDYLVPHRMMLEAESLRFFFVDPTWVGALLDGALSVARSSRTALLLDHAMAGTFAPAPTGTDAGDRSTQTAPRLSRINGFLMRSAIVSGWRGLKVAAFGADGQGPWHALRIERIGEDILLCIYGELVGKLVITQPPHGLHFSLPPGVSVPYRKQEDRVIRIAALAKPLGNSAEFANTMLAGPAEITLTVKLDEQS